MEDIDNIIINTLKHLNCPVDEEINSLKQFTNELVIKALMCCIDVISPGTGIPHVLPASMSQRLKLATNVADHIKELGFRGDVGYQMILYCNEVEIRRLLMFLIERLPRETDKTVHEDSSRISVLVKSVKSILSKSLKTAWLPVDVLRNDIRHSEGSLIRVGYGNCYNLECKMLHIPNTRQYSSEELKQYCVHHLTDVTKQCSYKNLIPSLLFNSTNNIIALNEKHVDEIININNKSGEEKQIQIVDPLNQIDLPVINISHVNISENSPDVLVTSLLHDIETGKEQISSLKDQIKILETKRLKLLETKTCKEKDLNTQLQNLDIKSKSHTLLSNKDNISKLETVVQHGTQKLVDLTQQWYSVQSPLLKQYRNIMATLNVNESETQDLQERLQVTKQKCRKANDELKEKDQLLTQLSEQYNKLQKQTNRSAYTRRILEIITNIKKQSNDIEKILKDTREVQKEINGLTGQLDRSFALADEVIFRDAKQDETARKSYKLLACMHNEYSEVIRASTELGAIIRETRNLQEQVDTEEAREISARLDRVMADLNQVRSETATLLKQKK